MQGPTGTTRDLPSDSGKRPYNFVAAGSLCSWICILIFFILTEKATPAKCPARQNPMELVVANASPFDLARKG